MKTVLFQDFLRAYLRNPKNAASYLQAVLTDEEGGDREELAAKGLANIAKAHGLTQPLLNILQKKDSPK